MAQQWGEDDEVLDVGGALAVAAPEEPWGQEDENLDLPLEVPKVEPPKIGAEEPAKAETPTWGLEDENLDFVPSALRPAVEPKPEEPADNSWDTLRGLEVAGRQIPQLAYGVAGLVGATAEELTGYGETLRDFGLRGYQDWEQSIEPISKETDDITVAWKKAQEGDLGALVDWAQYGIGYALGQLGETAAIGLLGGITGAVAGGAATAPAGGVGAIPAAAGGTLLATAGKTGFKAFAKNLIEKAIANRALKIAKDQATKEGVELAGEQLAKRAASETVKKQAGKEIGSDVAILGNALGMQLGSIYGEAEAKAKAEGRELTGVDLARVWGSGLVTGGAEGLVDKFGLDLLKGKFAEKLPAGRLAGAAVAGGIGLGAEAATEVAQTAGERFGAGKEILGEQAINEYINAGALGGLGGGLIGGAGGFISGNPKENAAAKAKVSSEINKDVSPATAEVVAKQADAVISEVKTETAALTPEQRREELTRRAEEVRRQAALAVAPEAVRRVEQRQGTEQPEVDTPTGTRVEAAAYKAPDGTVYYGPSHLEAMAKAKDAGKIEQTEIDAKQETTSRETPEFGFSTEADGFVSRDQAEVIARQSQQLLVEQPKTGKLHSDEVALDAFAQPEAAPPAPTPVDAIGRVVRGEQTPEDIDLLSKAETPFVEIYKDQPILTEAGIAALPEDQRPRLTPEMRKVQIDLGVGDAAAEAITKGLRIGVDQVPANVKMPEGWTLDGDVYVPPQPAPTAPAAPEARPVVAAETLNPRGKQAVKVLTSIGVDQETAAYVASRYQDEAGDMGAEQWRDFIRTKFEENGGVIPAKMRYSEDPEYYQMAFNVSAEEAATMVENAKYQNQQAAQNELEQNKQWRRKDEQVTEAERGVAQAQPEAKGAVVPTGKVAPRPAIEGRGVPVAAPTPTITPEEAQAIIDASQQARAKKPQASVTIERKRNLVKVLSLRPSNTIGKTLREALRFASGINLSSITASFPNEIMMQDVASILAEMNIPALDSERIVTLISRGKTGTRATRFWDGDIGVPSQKKISVTTLVHEAGHSLTADQIKRYAPRGKFSSGGDYIQTLRKVIADSNTPEPISRLFSLYISTLDQLGVMGQYGSVNGIAGTRKADVSVSMAQKLQRSGKLRKDITFSQLYGLASVEEFVSQTFSSVEMRDLLKTLKAPDGKRSAWSVFVDAIKNILNLPNGTMAAAVIEASVDVGIEVPSGQPIKGAGLPEEGLMAPEEADIAEQNREYISLVQDPEKNKTALQRIVDTVAKLRGYNSENLLFHGTTHIFNVFKKDRTNIENDFGKGYYFTNSESDAQINYAGEGPDLTNRIERLAEQFQSNEDMDEDLAKAKAREILTGGGQQIMRVYVRLDNPFNVGGPNETFLGYDLPYDETTEEYGEPTGTLANFINALRPIIETYAEDSPVDADKAVSNIIEQAIDRGGLTASELIKILKQEDSGIMWAADENGDLASSEIIRQAIEDSGFDGIVDSLVSQKFGVSQKAPFGMRGMGPDTIHTIVFNSSQIKSADAITRDNQGNIIPVADRFDPEREDILFEPEEGPETKTPEQRTIETLTDEFVVADKASNSVKSDKQTVGIKSIVDRWINSPEPTAQTLKDAIVQFTNLNENQATSFAEAVSEQLTIQKALSDLEQEIADQQNRPKEVPVATAELNEEAEPQFRAYKFYEITQDDLDPKMRRRVNKSYEVLRNDVTLKEAAKALRGLSIEAAIAEIRDMNNGIKPAVRSMMADITYQKVMQFRKKAKDAEKTKEYSDVTDVHVDFYNWISEYRKELGQGVQAFARFADLGPDGAIRHYAKYVDQAMKKLIPKNRKRIKDISDELNSGTEEEFNKTLQNKKQNIRENVVKAARNEAKKVTISEETQKVVQGIVRSAKPTLWENYQQLISDRLLRTLMADPNKTPPPSLVVFSNRLVQNLLGFVPEQQRKVQPSSVQSYIEDALNNKEKYEQAFNKTLEDVSNKVKKLKEKEGDKASAELARALAAQDFLERLAPQIKDFPVSAKTIDRFITQKAKDLEISLVQKFSEWYKSSVKERKKLEEEFAELFLQELNIPEADAKRLSDGIVADFKVRAEARRKKILERFKAPKDEREGEEVSPLDKFFEFVNMGFINDQAAYEILAERYGLPKYNEKFAKYIYDMAQKIQDMDDGLIKRETTHELMSAIAKERGFSGAEIGTGFIYANMLSSPDTHMVNVVDTMINNFANAISDVMATGDTSRLVGLIKGFRKGWNEAKNIMKTGLRISMPRFEERAPTVLELNQFGRKGGVNLATFQEINDLTKSLLENPAAKTLNAAKYVGRFLEAQDAVNFAMSVEGQRYADAAAMAKEEGVRGKRAIRKRISEILNDSDKQYQAALQQAKNEGFTGYRQIYRALEINEEKIPQEIKDRSFERGLRDVYRNIPTGVAGAMADTFFDFINRKVESPLGRSAIKLTVSPFVITPVNLFNKWLDWSPWGYKRLFFGSGGWLADKYQVQPFERGTPEWRAQLFKASSSVLAMGVVYSLVRAGIIALEGKGPSDEEERKQWLADGNKPYTIKFKNGPAFSFAYLPWAIPLAWLANVENYEKYNKGKDTGKMEAALVSMAFATNIVMELPFMAGVADIVDLINPRATTSAIKRFEKFAEGKIGMLFPNALRYIDRLFDPTLYDTQGLGGLFIDQTPFVRTRGGKRLNLFGEPIGEGKPLVERLASRFVALPKPSVESQLLAKFDVYPYIEGAGKAFTVVDGERVVMNQDEYEKYATGVGQEFKQFLLDNYDLQTEYTEEEKLEIAKEIRRQVEEIRKKWRIEVGSEE